MTPEQQAIIFAAEVPEGWRIVAHATPTRAFRVICSADEKTFRVEQLEAGVWKWHPRSTHSGDDAFESYPHALADMVEKQEHFKQMIIRARIDHKNALALAEKEHGNLS